jgi:aspartate aminotransferase
MTVAHKINDIMAKSSWIRKMFEEGARLKAAHGADKVFDFSLGNPNLPPPEQFNEILRDTVDACGLGDHCYMPQAGYRPGLRVHCRLPDRPSRAWPSVL